MNGPSCVDCGRETDSVSEKVWLCGACDLVNINGTWWQQAKRPAPELPNHCIECGSLLVVEIEEVVDKDAKVTRSMASLGVAVSAVERCERGCESTLALELEGEATVHIALRQQGVSVG